MTREENLERIISAVNKMTREELELFQIYIDKIKEEHNLTEATPH